MNWFSLFFAGVIFSPFTLPVFLAVPGTPAPSRIQHETPEHLLFLAWDEDVGRVLGQESDSWGPMGFAVRTDGGLLVLDQVNLRILEFDPQGRSLGNISLPGATFDDIAVVDDQAILVLDRLVTRTLLVLDPDGNILEELFLPGRGIEHAGNITAMFSREDGVWLEIAHRYSVRVLDRQLRPGPRQIIPGRPAAGHRSLTGRLGPDGQVEIGLQDRQARNQRTLQSFFPSSDPVRRIVHLDLDAGISLVWHEAAFDYRSPHRVLREKYVLLFLDGNGREIRRKNSPWVLSDLDQRVEFRTTAKGDLIQMFFAYDGVFFVKWNRRLP